jgi:hypothetical protein
VVTGQRPRQTGGAGSPGSSGAQQAAAFGSPDDKPDTLEERFGDEFFWQEAVVDKMIDDIKAVASQYDMDLDFLLGWFGGQQLNLINYLQKNVIDLNEAPGAIGLGPGFFTNTPAGINQLFAHARTWLGARFPALLDAFSGVGSSGSGRGRGRSGSGAAGPTPDQIRAQFDVKELTEAANTIWRGLLLEDMPNATAAANAYVEQIVANPEQKLDFESFVLGQVRNTSRYKVMYRNKPAAMTEQQFLMPIFQQVQQTLGPGYGTQVADITVNAARLSSSPQQLSERLMREQQVQTSSPYLQRLAQRVTEIKDVLR